MEETSNQSPFQTIRRLLPYLKGNRFWLRLIWFIGLIAGIMDFTNTYLLKTLTDSALSQQNDLFRRLVIVALVAMGIDIAQKYFGRIISSRYQNYTIRDLRDKVTAHIQRLPLSFTETLHSGDLVSRLNNDIDRIAEIPRRVQELVTQPVIFILGFSYMFLLSWKLLLASCILIPLSAILHDKVVRPMQAHSQKEMEHLARANAVTQDAIRGIYIIKAFNLQKLLTEKYQRLQMMFAWKVCRSINGPGFNLPFS